MNAVDASVAIAALASWHERHDGAVGIVRGARIPAHAAAETYSVLTRLPEPFRAVPEEARTAILETFRDGFLTLSANAYRELIDTAPTRGIVGGAIFDAIVAAAALEAGATLLTHDQRARRTYEAVGVQWELAG